MKDMFRDSNKRVWDVANRITFDQERPRKNYLNSPGGKMLDCDRKRADLEEQRLLEELYGYGE